MGGSITNVAPARIIDGFTQALKLHRYAVYVFDYGAPTGFRLAALHKDRVTAIISQNGNAYEKACVSSGISSGPLGMRRARGTAPRVK